VNLPDRRCGHRVTRVRLAFCFRAVVLVFDLVLDERLPITANSAAAQLRVQAVEVVCAESVDRSKRIDVDVLRCFSTCAHSSVRLFRALRRAASSVPLMVARLYARRPVTQS
jgi:hypothetical protein